MTVEAHKIIKNDKQHHARAESARAERGIMSLRENMYALNTAEEVDAFIDQNPTAAIFKAGTCHKTMQGWGNIESLLRDRNDVPVGIIRVVEARPASNRVAERTGITHQSPQLIVFQNQQAQFDLDNWNITLENLEPNFEQHLPESESAPTSPTGKTTNMAPYAGLMDQFIGGQIHEQQFQWTYLEMFRNDANLRSQEEFALLDSLFGNPDDHHIHAGAIMQLEAQQQATGAALPLLERVKILREQLNALA
jgi:bacillithiol system protein YtxJ